MWVTPEVNFVHGFDHDHSTLILTVRPREAKRFGSQREAKLWVKKYGKDFESYCILDGEQLLGSVQDLQTSL